MSQFIIKPKDPNAPAKESPAAATEKKNDSPGFKAPAKTQPVKTSAPASGAASVSSSSRSPSMVVIPAVSTPEVASASEAKPEAMPLKVEWSELGLSSDLIEHVKSEGLAHPTPVQAQSIPVVLDRQDVIVSAQTGTGKTAAFALPVIEKVRGRNGTYALVLCPTREIALQSQKVFEQLGKPFGITAISLIGGTPLKTDEVLLRTYPNIIIATPGRMCDHIERGTIWLEYLEMLVLDEADRMLEMGFATQLNMILDQTSVERQTLLFSATLSPVIEKLAQKILYQPKRIQVGKTSRTANTIEQRFMFVHEDDKFIELENLLYDEPGSTFVFTRSKENAEAVWRKLRNRGFRDATQLHSNLPQEAREEALDDFKSGKYSVLIATDVMGRGIHVDDVAHVINYDFPREPEDYVHRIGRTGRAESSGMATSFVTKRDYPCVKDVERLTGKKILPQSNSGSHAPQKPHSGAKRRK